MALLKQYIPMDLFDTSTNLDQENKTNDGFTFNLERDIVFFDIESTGLNVMQDRIIQIALIKYFKDNRPFEELELLVNPQVPISAEAMAVHGITPDDIRDKPGFKDVAEQVYNFIGDADLSGYNSDRFDIPMLTEELYRNGFDLKIEERRSIDVQKIFYKMEPRTLKAALKYFCKKELVDAHDALADVRATVDVLVGQIKRYEGVDYIDGDGFVTKSPIKNDMNAIHEFLSDGSLVDYTQRLKRDSKGEIVFNFGKYNKHKVADVFRRDKNYYHWIMQKDFSSQVKKIVSGIMKTIESSKK
ncbi:MAG: DNA polymerase-3 subunit epsilon [Saprospiraceae bacterium]|jgi:DNA polymerase-3 subunit epsilon